MILYIRALGFSEFDTKEKAEILVAKLVKDPTQKFVWDAHTDHPSIEYYREYGNEFGLMVRGALNEKEEFNVHSLLPYAMGSYLTDIYEVDVVKLGNQDLYHGFCDELVSGTPISFFVQNLMDYKEAEQHKEVYINGIKLMAYCVEGTIILPIDKDDTDVLLEEEEEHIRKELLEEARKGSEEAMDILDDEAAEASKVLQERLKKEDILSVLEGFFVPAGEQDDIYSILGIIEKVEELVNRATNEEIFRLKVSCMSIPIDVFVNAMDVVGYPTVGMRFKGTSWVHGKIEFEYYKKKKA